MHTWFRKRILSPLFVSIILLALGFTASKLEAADKLVAIYSARLMSQSMPWIAQEAGLFQKT